MNFIPVGSEIDHLKQSGQQSSDDDTMQAFCPTTQEKVKETYWLDSECLWETREGGFYIHMSPSRHNTRQEATHHPGLHSPDSLVPGIVRNIGRTVEKVVDSMASIRSHDRTAVCTGDGFASTTQNNKTTDQS